MWSARCFFVCKTFVSREKEKKVFDASQFSSAAFFLLLKKKRAESFRLFVTENL